MNFVKPMVVFCAEIVAILFFAGCAPKQSTSEPPAVQPKSLTEARQGFNTKLLRHDTVGEPPPPPPPGIFQLIFYPSPAGNLAAYLSPSPGDGKKHPVIIWLVGGFSSSIGEIAWTDFPRENDQSGSAFRKAGLLMMYPSFRGGNTNPGSLEGFYGEVDDVLSAISYLEKQDDIDPHRIYLGGHSTGGTLALLVAESTDHLRAVFSFGPVSDVSGYGSENLPFNVDDPQEIALRSPGQWLSGIRTPTFVFEGTTGRNNSAELRRLARLNKNPLVEFHPIPGATHFSTLAPATALIAAKILADTNTRPNLVFSNQELADALNR